MIRVLEVPDIHYGFDGKDPYVLIGGHGGVGWAEQVPVDPCPAYPHPTELVLDSLNHLERMLGLDGIILTYKPYVYLPRWESLSRANGWASRDHDYNYDTDRKPWEGHIVLNAKRTPILPQVTRYYVNHEYGHHCDWHARRYYGFDDDHPEPWEDEYRRLRGLSKKILDVPYEPGYHHMHIKEIMANDARILVMNQGRDFWPHPNATHPLSLSGTTTDRVKKWWLKALRSDIK